MGDMAFFGHNELKYYSFGLRAGVSNLFTSGLKLGGKKTLGKISQPINSYTRFPEYHYFDTAIRAFIHGCPEGQTARILDIGSPKTFGLYLASATRANVHMTDISELNVDEYRCMWESLQPKALGDASFSLQDARQLQFDANQFDVVYSMSVIEHVGASGDSAAMEELIRVLRPGGLLLVSVPFGPRFVEQQRIGFAGAIEHTNDGKRYFFQRIYDRPSIEQRLLRHAGELEGLKYATIWRKRVWLPKALASLGENVRGVLGFCNPLISGLVNESREGIQDGFFAQYEELQRDSDVYGDLVLQGRKPVSR